MIAIGSDHGDVEPKDFLAGVLSAMGVDVRGCGIHGNASVDYPEFDREVSLWVASGETERSVLVCTSRIGVCSPTGKPVGLHMGTRINGQEKK